MQLAVLSVIVFAVFVGVGGVMGYVKAGSTVSLVSGIGFAIALLVSSILMRQGQRAGMLLALVLTAMLLLLFVQRYLVSPALMPAGVMIIVSMVMLAVLIMGLR